MIPYISKKIWFSSSLLLLMYHIIFYQYI
jgi:hypothetical protein